MRMRKWLENIMLMMVIFFLVAAAIPAGLAEDGDRREGRLYTEVPDLVVTHAKVGDFDADGTCDGMRIYYKNKGSKAIPIDKDGFMASVVINDLYSRGYAGIYDERVDLPPELENIDAGQEFYELIPYESLLRYGFKPGVDNKVRVAVDTRDNIHELEEQNNVGVFEVDDDACRDDDDHDDNEKDDEDEEDEDDKHEDDDGKDGEDDKAIPRTDEQSCRAAGSLFENEGHEIWLAEKSIKVEFLEAEDDRGVFRVGENLIELKEGYAQEFSGGVIALKGLGKKDGRRYAVFVVECADGQGQKEEFKAEYKDADGEYKVEYKDGKVEYKIERQEDVCEGCRKDGACLGIGLRLIQDDTPSFCDIDGGLAPQKELDAACQNDYECKSNTCQSGACVDLQAQLAAQTSMLERILKWLEALFG